MPLPIALDYRPALLSPAGIGRVTRELARALAADPQLRLHLFGHCFGRARVPCELPRDAVLHRLPLPGRMLPLLHRVGLGADRLAGRPAVFHWTDYLLPPLSRARAIATVHDLAFVRDPSWHGTSAATLLQRTRAAVATARAIIVPSAATAADLRQHTSPQQPVHIVPFGADHVPPPPPGPDRAVPEEPFVLCVGTIEPRKNHRALLAAWRLLPAPRPLLLVVGGIGWQCDEIVAELRAAVATGAVRWLQNAGDATLWRLLYRTRLLVYPSLWEGFGLPPLEAMQIGLPVVAHACAPLQELGDGALLLTDATDPTALAAAIDRALRDGNLRAEASRNGRARAGAFRWADTAARHAAIYREVAAC